MGSQIKYLKANSIEEAVALLDMYSGKIKIFAGGTDLMVQMYHESKKLDTAKYFLDIHGIEELKGISQDGENISVGALSTHCLLYTSTVDGVTRELPKPFIVIATQNPAGAAGTQLLPESQMDRFMVRLSVGYPDKASEIGMLKGRLNDEYMDAVQKIITSEELLQIQNEVEQIYVHDKVYEYIVHLVSQTREHGYIQLGISPRGTIALLRMSKAIAYLNDRTYMIPDDVRSIFYDVAAHRILLSSKARINSVDVPMVIRDILQKTKAPVFKE